MTNGNPVLDTCGCCNGLKDQTPIPIINPPGLSAIAYRIGTHGKFKDAMISELSADPLLAKLTARDDGDPSISLIDAWAEVLDVLTFYQERIAEEGYLRTAAERCSILELARSIGYSLKPGLAASTFLAFELETAPSSPKSVRIDPGNRAQSIPGQNETPQTFETMDAIEARPEWNRLLPQVTMHQSIELSLPKLCLKGINTQLQPGDAIVVLGDARIGDASSTSAHLSEEWDLRIVKAIKTDTDKNQTTVILDRGLGTKEPKITNPARIGSKVFALRQRASLFGYNAPDFLSMPGNYTTEGKGDVNGWKDFRIKTVHDRMIDLDRVYPKVVKDSWIVLMSSKKVELYQVSWATIVGRNDFGLTGTVSRLTLDSNEHLHNFGLQDAVVLAQSEELFLNDIPLTASFKGTPSEKVDLEESTLTPVEGAQISLDRIINGLQKGRNILVSGKKIRVKLLEDIVDLSLNKGNVLQVVKSPENIQGNLKWQLRDSSGTDYHVETEPNKVLKLISSLEDDEIVAEAVSISETTPDSSGHTVISLEKSLENTYDRKSVSIYANVARATNGFSTEEVLGHGDASQQFQEFVLKQLPLTYIQSTTPGGGLSTLRIFVNGVTWKEVPSLYGLDGRQQVYITRMGDDGKTTVQFGDGVTGSRLSTGAEVKASYMKGTGLSGLVKANQISLLMTRPLGVKGVNNPKRPEGADDPEQRDQARRNAPFTVMTFDRVVSLRDYEDFARNFLGIGKAQATWLWENGKKVIHITIAAAGGGPLSPSSDLIGNLRKAVINAGDPHQPILVDPYSPSYFEVDAGVLIDRSLYNPEKVLAAVRTALENVFSFESRSFGQNVEEGDILTVIQSVEGVQAANLVSQVPFHVDSTGLLMINPEKIKLTEMEP